MDTASAAAEGASAGRGPETRARFQVREWKPRQGLAGDHPKQGSRAGPGHTQHWRTVWAQRSASLCPWDPSRALLQPHALTGSFLGPAGGLRSRLLVLGLYTHHLM